jgi:hypothetical protein
LKEFNILQNWSLCGDFFESGYKLLKVNTNISDPDRIFINSTWMGYEGEQYNSCCCGGGNIQKEKPKI